MKRDNIVKHVLTMTEIPEAASFTGTSLVYSEKNIAESCVNVDNCDLKRRLVVQNLKMA